MKRSYKKGNRLTSDEEKFIYNEQKCPDCEGSLREGPTGGMSINAQCNKCGAKFNIMGAIGIQRISDNNKHKYADKYSHICVWKPIDIESESYKKIEDFFKFKDYPIKINQ